MKLLRNHQRTQSELGLWAGNKRLVFSSFYFWNSGNELQMSLEGLYRSLLLGVCQQCPDLIPDLFPLQWNLLANGPRAGTSSEGLIDVRAIIDAFARLVAMDVSSRYRMCFFIDGLDEYTGDNVDYRALAETIRQLGESRSVKLCVSARPYEEFLDTFEKSQTLHLHALTSQDITKYSRDSFKTLQRSNLSNDQQLVETVVEKSQGVFLWAHVVVRALVSLANEGLDERRLLEALGSYPADIYDLYAQLLESLVPDDRIRSNQMLCLAVRNPFAQPINSLWVSWIDALNSPSFPSAITPYGIAEIRARHEAVLLDLDHLSKGLLEMHTDRRERKDGDQFYRRRIQFFHRTARDFLRSPSRLKQLVDSFGSAEFMEVASRLRLAEVILAGKYKKASGADPRRRRLYLNYMRSLFHLKDDSGQRYQIPHPYMLTLRKDIEGTADSSKFSTPYAVSHYTSITNSSLIDEDPEKTASFLHLLLYSGQHQFVLQELSEHGIQPAQRDRDELSLLLSALLGPRRVSIDIFRALWAHAQHPCDRIRIRQPLGNDFLTDQTHTVSIMTVFVATLAFTCHGEVEPRRESRTRSSVSRDPESMFLMLRYLLEAMDHENLSSIGIRSWLSRSRPMYLCLLHDHKRQSNSAPSDEVVYTTLGQLALRYAPAQATTLLPLLGEEYVLDEQLLDHNAPISMDPQWNLARLGSTAATGSARFITYTRLDKYLCQEVMSIKDSISKTENLYFRTY